MLSSHCCFQNSKGSPIGRSLAVLVAVLFLLTFGSFSTAVSAEVFGGGAAASTDQPQNASTSNTSTSTSTCTNPSVVPPGGITCQWLATEDLQWKPAVNSSIGWEVEFTRASYDNIGSTSPTVLQAELSMLLSSGASCIRIDIGYDAWLNDNVTTQNEMTSLVNQIKADGKCLIIADASAEQYRQYPIPWSNFEQAWVSRVQTLAALYHPSYYIVIKEPGWYAPMVSDSETNPKFESASAWTKLATELAAAVEGVSPSTQVGVSVSAAAMSVNSTFYKPFLREVQTQPSISFLGFDIYDESGFTNTQDYLSTYGSGGKSVWVAEAWSATEMAPNFYAFNPSRSSMDQLWIQSLYYFAVYMHISAVNAFVSDCFSSYTWDSNETGALISNYNLRTPVFYDFHELATTYGGAV